MFLIIGVVTFIIVHCTLLIVFHAPYAQHVRCGDRRFYRMGTVVRQGHYRGRGGGAVGERPIARVHEDLLVLSACGVVDAGGQRGEARAVGVAVRREPQFRRADVLDVQRIQGGLLHSCGDVPACGTDALHIAVSIRN